MRLEIVTRDGQTALDDLVFLNAPGREGRLTVEPGHEPLVCALGAGSLRVRLASGAEPVSYTHLTLPTIYSV